MKNVLIATLVLLFIKADAQKKNDSYFLGQIGLLNGDNYASAQVMISGGYEMKGIAFGLGAGMEYYKIRTVPLFAEVRAAIVKNRKAFIYLNGGPNFIWPLESQYAQHFLATGGVSKDQFKTGLYGDAGIGYTFTVNPKTQILFSLGYSVKTIHLSYSESVYTEFAPFTWQTRERKLDYTLNRIALRVGVKL